MEEARKVCYEARRKLGNYLDLVYFEILIAAVNGEIRKIPKFAKSYLEIYEAADNKFNPAKEKTYGKIGEVLLMSGQALEEAQENGEALEVYKKYLELYPDDEPIKDRVNSMELNTGQ